MVDQPARATQQDPIRELLSVVGEIRAVAAPRRVGKDWDLANILDGWGDRIEDAVDALAAAASRPVDQTTTTQKTWPLSPGVRP